MGQAGTAEQCAAAGLKSCFHTEAADYTVNGILVYMERSQSRTCRCKVLALQARKSQLGLWFHIALFIAHPFSVLGRGAPSGRFIGAAQFLADFIVDIELIFQMARFGRQVKIAAVLEFPDAIDADAIGRIVTTAIAFVSRFSIAVVHGNACMPAAVLLFKTYLRRFVAVLDVRIDFVIGVFAAVCLCPNAVSLAIFTDQFRAAERFAGNASPRQDRRSDCLADAFHHRRFIFAGFNLLTVNTADRVRRVLALTVIVRQNLADIDGFAAARIIGKIDGACTQGPGRSSEARSNGCLCCQVPFTRRVVAVC